MGIRLHFHAPQILAQVEFAYGGLDEDVARKLQAIAHFRAVAVGAEVVGVGGAKENSLEECRTKLYAA